MLKPMLARKYEDSDITFPVAVQPKYDGVRAIFDGNEFYTRTGKLVRGVDHLKAEAKALMESYEMLECTALDGELILDGTLGRSASFNELSGAVRSHSEDLRLRYVVYDYMHLRYMTNFRLSCIQDAFKAGGFKYLIQADTTVVSTAQELDTLHSVYVKDGFEGVMVRQLYYGYEPGVRSKGLLKLKEFDTEEFTIIGTVEGKGKLAGRLGALHVRDDTGRTFMVKLAETEDRLLELWDEKCYLFNKQVTVKYQGKSANGIPRFPIGLTIRDYE